MIKRVLDLVPPNRHAGCVAVAGVSRHKACTWHDAGMIVEFCGGMYRSAGAEYATDLDAVINDVAAIADPLLGGGASVRLWIGGSRKWFRRLLITRIRRCCHPGR
jgi:hypothetical protein